MARLLSPVMNTISVMPAATASSTAYWISGLSTTGIISFGLALVAGRKRLPMPATGKTAFVIFFIDTSFSNQNSKGGFRCRLTFAQQMLSQLPAAIGGRNQRRL